MTFRSYRGLICAVAAAAPLAMAAPAWSHHSAGAYDHTKEFTVTGTVTSWQWTNPHCFMTVNGPDATGKVADYVIEWPAPMQLQQRGYTRNLAKVGDKVLVKFHPNKDGKPGGLFTDITTPDGKSLKAHQAS
jgi:hypothetical protein